MPSRLPTSTRRSRKGTLTSERLVQMFLARIEAYDRQGPSLRSVITVNPKALETARALDAERKTKGPRSPLHGIPIVVKDNIDTADMPTTGGSVLLEGSIPPDDAFVVKKLRAAGAVIIAKANLSEFASGARARARSAARFSIRTISRGRRPDPPAAPASRWPPRLRWPDSAPIPADRFAVRRPPTASPASRRRWDWSAATA